MSVILKASGGGSVTLQEPSTASDYTLSLPATTGTVVVSGTTPSLNGIAFPATQSASADANTLDDYEEGSVSQPLRIGSSNQVDYYTNYSRYTKIGNTVVYLVDFDTFEQTLVATGGIGINLPFTSVINLRISSSAIYGQASTSGGSNNNTLGAIAWLGNSSYVELYTSFTFGTQASAPDTNERFTCRFVLIYQV
jgi:hypothetical protein